ncbi:hypothetical protein V6B16_14915 [Salinimicrobium catena]|uniref:hypothetical protein n=1 Tax=Salinimicrobium catena TaxID=390640 RepID=UPI002FE4DC0F
MSDKKQNIKNWIEKNGYPFEMMVAKSFKKAGFEISQSVLFKDEETGKYRETDIIAHESKNIEKVWFNISFIVECKKSNDKPWIIFKNNEQYTLLNKIYPVLITKNGNILIDSITKNSQFRSPLLFPEIKDSGYNIVTAFNSKSDTAYSASQSVLKACEYLLRKSNDSDKRFCNLYVPIIAIEGELFESHMDSNNDLELNEVDYSSVISTKSFEEKNSNYIRIVSSKNLDNFTLKLRNEVDELFDKYSNQLKITLHNYPVNKTNRNFVI